MKYIFRLLIVALFLWGVWYVLQNYDILGWAKKVDDGIKNGDSRTIFILPKKFGERETEHRISIGKDCQFSPPNLIIEKNDKVIWVNRDNVDHQISGAVFTSSFINYGRTYARLFKESGTFDYGCSDDSENKGQIIVK